jgi:hypothetical protein
MDRENKNHRHHAHDLRKLEAQITSETNNGGCKTPLLNEMIEKL